MLLKFKTKDLLVISSVKKKIGSDGLFHYEINGVTGLTFGAEIDG